MKVKKIYIRGMEAIICREVKDLIFGFYH